MARVIATGPKPPGRSAMLGAALGGGLGQGFADEFSKQRDLQQQAKMLNPMREALLEQLGGQQGSLTPQQQLLFTAAQDPTQFAMMARDPRQLMAISQMAAPPQRPSPVSLSSGSRLVDPATGEEIVSAAPDAPTFTRVVTGEDRLNREFDLGLAPGQSARVQFTRDPQTGAVVKGDVLSLSQGSGEDGAGLPFGKGLRGRALAHVSNLAPRFAAGELTPDEERIFHTAVVELRQPDQFRDPDTDLLVTQRGELPAFVLNAYRERGVPLPERAAAPAVTPPAGSVPPPEQLAANSSTQGFAKIANEDPQAAAVQQTQAIQQTPTVPPDAVLPSWAGEETIAEAALEGKVTGPVPAIARGLTRIPLLGIDFPEQSSLKETASVLRNRFVKALQTNPRYAVAERQDIIQDLALDPAIIDTPQAFINRLIGVDRALESLEEEMRDVVGGRRALVSGETRQHALDTLQTIQHYRRYWMPPRVETFQESEAFSEANPPGTKFMYRDEDGSWQIYETTGGE